MRKSSLNIRINNKITELARSKTSGELIDIVNRKLSKIQLLSFPNESIGSLMVNDLGILFKTRPFGITITLDNLSIDDKLDILEKLK